MTRERAIRIVFAVGVVLCSAPMVSAQATSRPAEPPPAVPKASAATASAPAEVGGEGLASLRYEVIAVQGKVRVSATGQDPMLDEGWTPVQIEDQLVAGQQVYIPLRGVLKLVARPADPPTVMLIEPGSLVNIAELSFEGGVAKSRIGLAYGAIRAGVAEGTARSDMQIQCPTATLSKRGTDIFRFEYHNHRFMMSLSEQGRGMIQAIQMQHGAFGSQQMRSRFVTPGQFVTYQMARAIDNMQFERQININDLFGLIGTDQFMLMQHQLGLGFLLPQGMNYAGLLDSPVPPRDQPGQAGTDPLTQALQQGLNSSLFTPTRRNQHAGDFGVGQGGLPGIFDQSKAIQRRESLKALKAFLTGRGRR